MLKERKISILATDNHRENSVYTQMDKILKTLNKYAKKDYVKEITIDNQEKILKGDII